VRGNKEVSREGRKRHNQDREAAVVVVGEVMGVAGVIVISVPSRRCLDISFGVGGAVVAGDTSLLPPPSFLILDGNDNNGG